MQLDRVWNEDALLQTLMGILTVTHSIPVFRWQIPSAQTDDDFDRDLDWLRDDRER
jgi:hypothetical protein